MNSIIETKKQITKEFNKEFVKDNGPNIEDTFIDAVGSVGPIKQFISKALDQIAHAVIEYCDKEVIGEDQSTNTNETGSSTISMGNIYKNDLREKQRTKLSLLEQQLK